MDKKLEKKLMEEFPTFFKDMYGDMTKTCMHWGCAHGDGWYKILHNACKKIAKIDKGTFHFEQIKEKFGGLRLYCSGSNEEIFHIIDAAEKKSYKTCEHCGTKKNVTTEGSWILTLCKTCREKA